MEGGGPARAESGGAVPEPRPKRRFPVANARAGRGDVRHDGAALRSCFCFAAPAAPAAGAAAVARHVRRLGRVSRRRALLCDHRALSRRRRRGLAAVRLGRPLAGARRGGQLHFRLSREKRPGSAVLIRIDGAQLPADRRRPRRLGAGRARRRRDPGGDAHRHRAGRRDPRDRRPAAARALSAARRRHRDGRRRASPARAGASKTAASAPTSPRS